MRRCNCFSNFCDKNVDAATGRKDASLTTGGFKQDAMTSGEGRVGEEPFRLQPKIPANRKHRQAVFFLLPDMPGNKAP